MSRPEFVQHGTQVMFREGKTKMLGIVSKMVTNDESVNPERTSKQQRQDRALAEEEKKEEKENDANSGNVVKETAVEPKVEKAP
jgi:hypothetical protein